MLPVCLQRATMPKASTLWPVRPGRSKEHQLHLMIPLTDNSSLIRVRKHDISIAK